MTKLDAYITDKVREMRERLGYTPNDLGNITGISPSFFNSIESKKSHEKYNLEHLSKIAFLFRCKIADFFPDDIEEILEKENLSSLKAERKRIKNNLDKRITKRR